MSMSTTDADQFRFPYPGLRPFRQSEADIFFGRGEQIDQMLTKLEDHRFLAVVGASGSGKSSLVRAGLLPSLEDGFLSGGGDAWRMIVMRPGDAPYARLAEAFQEVMNDDQPDAHAEAFLEATLRAGPNGLVEATSDARLPQGTSVLLLVDQFEELFRFRHRGSKAHSQDQSHALVDHQRNAATGFVNLLLATADQAEIPIYVVITMRSDFLGDCDAFRGLPEAINDSQFLTPRLTRDQLRETITGPLALFGATAEPALVNRVLNDVGNDSDQLPLMQHALMRTWLRHQDHDAVDVKLRLGDYEQIGGLDHALSDHADEAFEDLDGPEKQRVAELMFRALCDSTQEGRLTRRLVTIGEVANVAGVEPEMVCRVARRFLRSDRSFLVITPVGPLEPDTILDISHEALIRQWRKLGEWIVREQELAAIYLRLAETARLWKQGKAGLWGSPELDIALEWRQREHPTEAWAMRYDAGFEVSREFLRASEQQRDLQVLHRRRQRRLWNQLLIGTLVAVSMVGIWINYLHRNTKLANERLQENLVVSELAVGGARIGQGQLAEGLDAYWRAFEHTQLGDQKRRTILTLIGAWSHHMGQRLQHDAAVTHVAFSPDDATILTASGDNIARLWNAATREPRGQSMRHADRISDIAFSLDGSTLLTGSADKTARLWDARTGATVGKPMPHPDSVLQVAYSPDKKTLATSCRDGIVRFWLASNGQPDGNLDAVASAGAFEFSPDGIQLAVATPGAVVMVDVERREQVWTHEVANAAPNDDDSLVDASIPMVSFSKGNSEHLLVGTREGTLALLNARTGEALWETPGSGVGITEIACGPDDRSAISIHEDHTGQLWNIRTGNPISSRLTHVAPISSVTYSLDGRYVLTGSHDNTAKLWVTESGLAYGPALRHQATVASVAFSSDGEQVLTGSYENSARIWKVDTGVRSGRALQPAEGRGYQRVAFSSNGDRIAAIARPVKKRVVATTELWDARAAARLGEPAGLNSVAMSFSSDSRKLFIASRGAKLQIVDVAGGQVEKELQLAHQALDIAAGPDGRQIFVGFDDGTAGLIDLASGESVRTMTASTMPIRVVAISPDGSKVVVGAADGMARVWPTDGGPPLVEIVHDEPVTAAAFSPDGTAVATASEDDTARLWDATGTRVMRHQENVVAVAFSPDGHLLLTGSDDNSARLWDVRAATDMPSKILRPEPMRHAAPVTSVAFSPDSQSVVTGSRDKTAQLWDAATGQPRGEPMRHEGDVLSVAFSSDGRTVATASEVGPPRLWEVPPPAIDDARRLRLSLEVRTGYHLTEDGNRRQLSLDEWLDHKRELDQLDGPCDVRQWDDVRTEELHP